MIGKWKFSALGKTIYLTVKNETDFIIEVAEAGRIEGTYSVNGTCLTLTVDGQAYLSGKYSVSGDRFTFECLGDAVRTEETSRFLLRMAGASMNDTLNEGDILTVECVDLSEFKRFDIVAVHYPERGTTLFVKRLIAFPGEVAELRDGYLYINGERFEELYINDDYRTGIGNTFGPYEVPENSYFVLGDHRNNSNDSRFIKALPAEMMIGVVTAINGEMIPAKQEAEFLKEQYPLLYRDEIEKWAGEYGIDPALVASVIRNESSFRPEAESSIGARGLMQLMPKTSKWIAEKLQIDDYSFESLYDPEINIHFGCWYIHYLSNNFGGDMVCIVSGLHAGPGQVITWLQDPSISTDGKSLKAEALPEGPTKIYAQRVIRDFEVYKELYRIAE